MKTFTSVLALLTIASPARAALAPFWQSVREIETMIKDHNLTERLRSVASIREIRKTTEGYRLTTEDGCFIAVRVKYLPTQRLGADKFELVLVDSGCKRK